MKMVMSLKMFCKLHDYIFLRYVLLIWKCKIGNLHAEMARSANLIKGDYHKQIFKLWSVKLKPYNTLSLGQLRATVPVPFTCSLA